MVRKTFHERIKLAVLFVTIVVTISIIYSTTENSSWHFSFKVAGNMSLGTPVNKSALMDCQKKTEYLKFLFHDNSMYHQRSFSRHCPIRDVIITLHTRGTSDEDFTRAVLSLGECHGIYYPRVPKCASRTVITIFRQLAKKHHFRTPSSVPIFDFGEPSVEHEYITNVSNQAKPFLFSRQVHYLNFTRHHSPLPVHIGIIRDPVARLTSSYYYRIHGSYNQNYTHELESALPTCVNKTLDGTVADLGYNLTTEISLSLHPCWPRATSQLIFFCDCLADCQKSSKYRLNQAMRTLEKDFLLVGMTENIPEFMEALGLLLPHFFKGAKEMFESNGLALGQKTKTRKKALVNPETHGKLRRILADDYTFYYFAKQRFKYILNRLRHSQSYIEQLIRSQL